MKAKDRSTKLFAMVMAIGMLGAICMVWPASRTAADDEYREEFIAYGVANISRGQTARLHVVTVGIPDIQPAELLIYDSHGNLLAHSSQRLLPGRAVSLDLPFSEQPGITGIPGDRLEFYAVVRFASQRGRDRGYVIPTLEVIEDATGKTIFMIACPIA
jgi:hypothetical protein